MIIANISSDYVLKEHLLIADPYRLIPDYMRYIYG